MQQGQESPEVVDLQTRVSTQLGSVVDAIDHHGGIYARSYAAWLKGVGPQPTKHVDLPTPVAKIIRDLVLDEAHVRSPVVRCGIAA